MSLLKTIEHIVAKSNPLPIKNNIIDHINVGSKIATDSITIKGQ